MVKMMTVIDVLEQFHESYIIQIWVRVEDRCPELYYRGALHKFWDKYDNGDIPDFISSSSVVDYGRTRFDELFLII